VRAAAAPLLLLLSLNACGPKAAPPQRFLDLDCKQPFQAQADALVAQPNLVPAGEVGAEPYRYYSSADGQTSYLITKPGSPAHPAILMQRARNGVHTSGCAWGDRKAYDELLAYLESLKTWTRTGAQPK